MKHPTSGRREFRGEIQRTRARASLRPAPRAKFPHIASTPATSLLVASPFSHPLASSPPPHPAFVPSAFGRRHARTIYTRPPRVYPTAPRHGFLLPSLPPRWLFRPISLQTRRHLPPLTPSTLRSQVRYKPTFVRLLISVIQRVSRRKSKTSFTTRQTNSKLLLNDSIFLPRLQFCNLYWVKTSCYELKDVLSKRIASAGASLWRKWGSLWIQAHSNFTTASPKCFYPSKKKITILKIVRIILL